jgi:hypothetical protein
MKASDYELCGLIRRQHKLGIHVAMLAARHNIPVEIVVAIVACRTREGAAKVLQNCKSLHERKSLQQDLQTPVV